jgi:Rieske Fe-S protein
MAPEVSRRTALLCGGAACAGAIAGCSTYGRPAAAPAPAQNPAAQNPAAQNPAAPGQAPPPAQVLATTTDVPLGGGKVLTDKAIVLTQPTAGTFKAFTAICTHQQCTVGDVSGGTINCPCHGSKFHIADGSVAHGPAASPLASIAVRVEGTSITQA